MNYFKNSRKNRFIALALVVILIVSSVYIANAEELDSSPHIQSAESAQITTENPSSLTAPSAPVVTIGQSGDVSISTAQELVELASQINSGNSMADQIIALESDIELAAIANWQAIGTDYNPFSGTFEGNGHTISGVASETVDSLFGTLRGATIKNLNVTSVKVSSDGETYKGLAKKIENSDIINCRIDLTALSYSRAAMGARSAMARTNWYNMASQTGTVSDSDDMFGFVQLVENGTINSASVITFGNVDMAGVTGWVGIGSPEHPFRGTAQGGTITDLEINQPSIDHVGLFAVTDEATLTNIALKNVNIVGENNVGGLVGHAINTEINGVSVSGQVVGVDAVGGIVGDFEQKETSSGSGQADRGEINDSFSTANVTGASRVGGVLGAFVENGVLVTSHTTRQVMNNLFSTGNISGDYGVGGIVGRSSFLGGAPSTFTAQNLASTSLIVTSSNGGGIIGSIDNDLQFEHMYFAGVLYGDSFLGGIAGESTNVATFDMGYVSGYVITSTTDVLGAKISYGVGGNAASPMDNFLAMPNSAYPSYNVLNRDMSVGAHTFEADAIMPGIGMTFDYFTNDDDGTASLLSGFDQSVAPLAFTAGSTNNNPVLLAIGGDFPELSSFSLHTNAAFNQFSKISTDPILQSLESSFYRDPATGEALSTKNTPASVINLPTITGGNGEWTLSDGKNIAKDGDGSIKIPDKTLESRYNEVTLVGNRIIISQPVSKEFSLLLSFSVISGPLHGMEASQQVLFMDETIRPIYSENSSAFIDSPTPADITSKLSGADYMSVLHFDETITMNAGGTVQLFEYANTDFVGVPVLVTPASPITTSVVGDGALKITWPRGTIKWDKSYKITLNNLLEDSASTPNIFTKDYYFVSASNLSPALSFDRTIEIAQNTNSSTDANAHNQTIYMIQNSDLYFGRLDGVNVVNESYIELESKVQESFNVVYTMAGREEFAGITVDKTNFQGVPGTYEITYMIADPESNSDPLKNSNTIKRTYQVYGVPKVTVGGSPFNSIVLTFNQIELLEIYGNMVASGSTAQKAIEDALIAKYITKSGSDQIAAIRYGVDAQPQALAIKFDTTGITDAIFSSSYEQPLYFDVEGEKYAAIFSIKSAEPEYEIILENDTYTAYNTFNREDAVAHFGATVIKKSTGKPVNVGLDYDFKGINKDKSGIPQTVKITVAGTKGVEIMGKSMEVSTNVSVIIKKEVVENRTDLDKETYAFWENTLAKMKKWDKENLSRIEMTYYQAKYVPGDFFNLLGKHVNATSTLVLPSGVEITAKSSVYSGKLVESPSYALTVEPMYNMKIFRDAGGKPVRAFSTVPQELPGELTVSLPLEIKDNGNLALYFINADTGKYVLVRTLKAEDIVNGRLTLKMTNFEGKYVVTSADLNGKISSVK